MKKIRNSLKGKAGGVATYWSRRKFIKAIAGIPLFGFAWAMPKFAWAEEVPPEYENLDETTFWH